MKIDVGPFADKSSIGISATKKYVDYLESNPEFESAILSLRKKFDIHEEWFSVPVDQQFLETEFTDEIAKSMGLNTYDDLSKDQLKIIFGKWHEIEDDLYSDCKSLTAKMHLPYHWYISILWLVVYDRFPVLEQPQIDAIPGDYFASMSKQVGDEEYCANTVHIIVHQNFTLAELHKLIDSEWVYISDKLKNLPDPKRHKWLRSDLAKRIVNLRDQMRLSFPKIAEVVSRENEGDIDLYSKITEDYVKNLYHRWKKKVSLTVSIS